jgi:hypothetical protein
METAATHSKSVSPEAVLDVDGISAGALNTFCGVNFN